MITLLTGPNSYSIAEFIRGKTRDFTGDAERYEGRDLEPRHVPDIFAGVSLFSPKRLVILRDISTNKAVWAELEKWVESTPDDTDIVLIEQGVDKRTRTYKLLQKYAVIHEHGELNEQAMIEWLQLHAREQELELQPDIIKYLVSYVGKDQWRLRNELEKLTLSGKPITKQLIQDVVEPYPEATAFELLDSVFRRDTESVEQLVALLSGREDPYQFFGLLSSQVQGLLALSVGQGKRPADIARDHGLHPFVISKLAPVASKLGRSRIDPLVEDLAQCDIRIKTSGVNPWQQLRLTLLKVCAS